MPEIRHSRLDFLALASMEIEKVFLVEMKCTDNLYDRVIELFLKEEEYGFCLQIFHSYFPK